MILCFHIGADYLIDFLSKVAGRLWGLIGLGSSTPESLHVPAYTARLARAFQQASLRIAYRFITS